MRRVEGARVSSHTEVGRKPAYNMFVAVSELERDGILKQERSHELFSSS